MAKDGTLRIGVVKYLNSRPLCYGIEKFLPEASFDYDYPSRLARKFSLGLLDVCLVSSIEFFMHPDYEIISNACVASDGPVLSVKLFSRKHLHKIKTLALDAGSVTSSLLARILLLECFDIQPEIETFSLESPITECHSDALLMIGDRALKTPDDSFPICIDLSELWKRVTKKPFVFACWLSRTGQYSDHVVKALESCRDEGVNNLDKIAREESSRLSLDQHLLHSYLNEHLSYHLDLDELEGLMHFGDFARTYDFIPKERNKILYKFEKKIVEI